MLLLGATAVSPNALRAEQGPATAAAAHALPSATDAHLRESLADVRARLARHAGFGNPTNPPPGATATEGIEYRSLLQRLAQTYQAHLDDLAAYEAVRRRIEDFDREVQSWPGFPEPPPFSVLFADEIRETAQTAEKKIRALETAASFIRRFASDMTIGLEASEGKIRKLNEQLEVAAESAQRVRLLWLRDLEQARRQAAAASITSLDTKSKIRDLEREEHRRRLTFARRQSDLIGLDVVFPQRDLDRVLGQLNLLRTRLKEEELDAYARLAASQAELASARTNLQQALASDSALSPDDIRTLREIVDTRHLQVEAHTEHVACLRQLLRGTDTEARLWQLRFSVFQRHDPAEIATASQNLDALHELIRSAKPYYTQQIELLAGQIEEQQKNGGRDPVAHADPVLARQRAAARTEQMNAYRRVLDDLDKRERMILGWRETFQTRQKTIPLRKRVRGVLAALRGAGSRVWGFELFVVQDTIRIDGQTVTGQRGITVGKLLTALLMLVAGLALSKRVARRLERLAIERLKIGPNQANLIRRWSHVIFVAVLLVFCLVSVKIPLTVFAFAGGALAIGVGFGTQNLLKNFISGIIILFERPFRVGDVLDVAGQRGKVTAIGIRSSVIQLFDHTETLIPNSALLENNLTNWTYSNGAVRFTVAVGVAYGSDTRRVAQLLADAAERHGHVQKEPKPVVLFANFGDNALAFELLYWVDVLKHNANKVASDLRHMIAGAFAENGVVMAFPQRDIHVDTARPLQIRLLPQQDVPPPAE
jgi:small-conductance mechanosensitive channel